MSGIPKAMIRPAISKGLLVKRGCSVKRTGRPLLQSRTQHHQGCDPQRQTQQTGQHPQDQPITAPNNVAERHGIHDEAQHSGDCAEDDPGTVLTLRGAGRRAGLAIRKASMSVRSICHSPPTLVARRSPGDTTLRRSRQGCGKWSRLLLLIGSAREGPCTASANVSIVSISIAHYEHLAPEIHTRQIGYPVERR